MRKRISGFVLSLFHTEIMSCLRRQAMVMPTTVGSSNISPIVPNS